MEKSIISDNDLGGAELPATVGSAMQPEPVALVCSGTLVPNWDNGTLTNQKTTRVVPTIDNDDVDIDDEVRRVVLALVDECDDDVRQVDVIEAGHKVERWLVMGGGRRRSGSV